MARISYSELSTFDMCPMQHLYRYHFRLQSRKYGEKRALYIGSIVHNVIEKIYKLHLKNPFPNRQVPSGLVRTLIEEEKAKVMAIYLKEENRAYGPVPSEFRLDSLLALCMARLFSERIFPDEPYEMLAPEYKFEQQIGNHTFIGFVDGVVMRHDEALGVDLVFPGEVKTWSNSRSVTKLDKYAAEDLQTDIYSLAILKSPFMKEGRQLGGKIYTVYRKPPSKILKPSEYDSWEDQKSAVEAWYEKTRTPLKRVEHRIEDLDVQAIEARIESRVQELQKFYEDPYESAASFRRPQHENRFPCSICEYSSVCRSGDLPGAEFDYKKGRAKSYK
jgi:hypothetical protein